MEYLSKERYDEKAGDVVEVNVPAGKLQLRIESVTLE